MLKQLHHPTTRLLLSLIWIIAAGCMIWDHTHSSETVLGPYRILLLPVSQLFLWGSWFVALFGTSAIKPKSKFATYAMRGLTGLLLAGNIYQLTADVAKLRQTTQNQGLVQYSPLVQAILKNDLERVRTLVASGESVFSRDQMDLAPFDYAAGAMPGIHGWPSGSVAIADLLLKQGCDVNGAGKFGRTPLMYAVRSGNPDLIRFLIDHGADVDRISNDGHTALFFARLDKNEPVIKLLLDAGAKSEGPGEGSPSTLSRVPAGGSED